MKQKKEHACPVVICDFCWKEISEAKDGNCQWKMEEEDSASGAVLCFTHKECCHPFEHANKGNWGAQELDCFMVYLANNTKLDLQGARKKAQFLDSIG